MSATVAPTVDRAAVVEIRERLAAHFRREADWRWRVAKRYPEREWQNNRAALGLANAADQVRRLPADDPRLVRLAELAGSLSFRDARGRDVTAELAFWTEDGKLDALLRRIIEASERAAAETVGDSS